MKKTLKLITGIILLTALMLNAGICVFAAVPTADGVYSVPVTLYHSEKDKESMGNKYIVQTALITVKDGKKSITVVADGVDGLTFSYYTNGSVEGATADAKKVSDIEINGKSYAEGFEFPLVTDNQYVGVKFKAPIMPMSPSARLKIDYSGIKALSVAEPETTVTNETEADTTKPEEDITVTEISSGETEPESETQVDETVPQLIAAPEDETGELSSQVQNKDEAKSFPVVPVVAGIAVVAAAVIVGLIIKKKK
ncbi:MAG: NEAT domain-containing protein [Clostridia bacterium]|nr:NEAT domain-containing protein [Clostridia bacterium]